MFIPSVQWTAKQYVKELSDDFIKRETSDCFKIKLKNGVGKPMGPCGLKIKLLPGVRGDSKEGKRSTSSNRRFK